MTRIELVTSPFTKGVLYQLSYIGSKKHSAISTQPIR